MSEDREDITDKSEEEWRAKEKSRDAALILPIIGAILLLPPIVEMFGEGSHGWGGLSVAVYLFSIWALMIFCAWRISIWLGKDKK